MALVSPPRRWTHFSIGVKSGLVAGFWAGLSSGLVVGLVAGFSAGLSSGLVVGLVVAGCSAGLAFSFSVVVAGCFAAVGMRGREAK